MTKTHSMKIALMLSGVALIALTKGAQAGFEWKGPLEAPPSLPAAAAPVGDDGMSDLAPVTGEVPAAAPVSAPPAAWSAPHQNALAPAPVATPAPAPAQMPVVEAAATPAPQGGDVLAGFGADLPLVIALQQVVPPGYQYSFSGNVNPGVLVSWEGGRPWQQVLADMLARQGLGFKVQDNAVIVGYHSSPVAPQQQAMSQMPPSSAMQAEGTEDMPAPIDGTQPVSITQAPAAAPAQTVAEAPAAPAEERVEVRRKKKPFWKKLAWWQKADEPGEQENDNAGERTASEANTASYWGTDETAHWRNEPSGNDRTAGGAVPSYRPERLISHPPAPTPKSDAPAAMSAPASSGGMSAEPDLTAPPASDLKSYPPEKSGAMDSAPAPSASAAMAASADGEAATSAPVQVATAASPDAAAAMDSKAGSWQGGKGQTLRDVLKSWSDKAGVELYWSIDYDYRLTDSVGYPGSFDEAVGRLLDKFAAVRPQPYGQLHQGSSGPRVLVIKSYDISQ